MKLLKPEDFPKLIRVGETDYRVCFANKLSEDLLGFCDFEMSLIVLAKDQDLDSLNATWWHELLHAMEHEFKIKLGHSRINKLEWSILEVLKQMPD